MFLISEPEGVIPFCAHLYLATVLKVTKLSGQQLMDQLLGGKLEHICTIEQVPISGSVATIVRVLLSAAAAAL